MYRTAHRTQSRSCPAASREQGRRRRRKAEHRRGGQEKLTRGRAHVRLAVGKETKGEVAPVGLNGRGDCGGIVTARRWRGRTDGSGWCRWARGRNALAVSRWHQQRGAEEESTDERCPSERGQKRSQLWAHPAMDRGELRHRDWTARTLKGGASNGVKDALLQLSSARRMDGDAQRITIHHGVFVSQMVCDAGAGACNARCTSYWAE